MRRAIFLIFVSIVLTLLPACGTSTSPSPTEKLDNIRLVGTIGPLAIPLAYMVENNKLASVANETTFSSWANPAQLQSIIAGGQADFISLPTNSAATFYNRGITLKMLDVSIWNILYVVTTDSSIMSAADLKGKRVAVPYEGAVPDAMFRYILLGQGVNPDTDLTLVYSSDPVQASQLLLSGQEQYALLSEPSATSVIMRGQSSGINLIRALNMKIEWAKVSEENYSTSIAGNAALGSITDNSKVINTFEEEYQRAVQWVLDNPEEAGQLGAKYLSEQGFTAEALTESLKNIEWRYASAESARQDMESFFGALSHVSPNYIGGKLPDSAFYYETKE